MPDRSSERLYRLEKAALVAGVILVVAFGVLTEIRSAFQHTRKTDAGVYFRAAWAARTGRDLFSVTDDNGWHYCYPSAFALVLVPLADPPADADRTGYLPYELSVAIWYLVGVCCAGWSVHVLASCVLPDAVRGTRRWWYARVIPLDLCLGGIGHTLGRGQVNLLVVALIAASFAAIVANRRFRGGMGLAGAVCVKIIPGLLILYPLVRRDRSTLLGVVVGGVLLLGIIPALWWGGRGMIEGNRKLVELVLMPGATGTGDQTRAEELTETKSTDSQSFVAAIHAWQYPDRESRPDNASRNARLIHLALAGGLTLITVGVGWRRLGDAVGDQLTYLGCLAVVMLLASPVSHMHYYVFALPLVAGLWLRSLAQRPQSICADPLTTTMLTFWAIATALPLLPGPLFDYLRERGWGIFATLIVWAFGLSLIASPFHGIPRMVIARIKRLTLSNQPRFPRLTSQADI